jgi:tetratricopeptide (TPR) repeat protein
MVRRSRSFLVLLMTFAFLSTAQADTLTLKSGKIVEGKIVERTSRAIQLDVGLDFPITYYTDEIQDISESSVAAKPSQPAASSKAPAGGPHEAKADQLEQKGLSAIDEGRMDEGLSLLQEALKLDPQGSRHLNFGTILFGNGVSLQKRGNSEESIKVFRQAEEEIQQALKLFDPEGETTFISQAYSLLGEMYANAFNDNAKAKTFYEKALSFYENPAARRGLAALP